MSPRMLVFVMALALSIPLPLYAGDVRGPLVNVATNPLAPEQEPDVAGNTQEDLFLVVFTAFVGAARQVHGQLVTPGGALSGAPFQVSLGPGAAEPALAYDPDRNAFLVVWQESTMPASVVGRRVESGGAMPAGPFTVLAGPSGVGPPDVAYSTGDREFLVVAPGTCNPGQPGINQIFGHRVAGTPGTGNTPGNPQLNCCAFPIIPLGPSCGASKALAPAVAYDAIDNHFLVVWEWAPGPPRINDVDGRIVGLQPAGACAAGNCATFLPAAGTLPIANTNANEHRPDVAWSAASNQFLVVLTSEFTETCCIPNPFPPPSCLSVTYTNPQVAAQRVTGPGALLGANFAVSTYTNCVTLGPPRPSPDHPRVAADTSTESDFLIAWEQVPPGNPTPPRDVTARAVLSAPQGAQQFAGTPFAVLSGGSDEYAPACAYGERCNLFLVAFERLGPPAPGNRDVVAHRVAAAASFPRLTLSHRGLPRVGDTVEISLQGIQTPVPDAFFLLWLNWGVANGAPPLCSNPFPIGLVGFVFDLSANGILVFDNLNPADRTVCLSLPVPNAVGFQVTFEGLTAPAAGAPLSFTACETLTIQP